MVFAFLALYGLLVWYTIRLSHQRGRRAWVWTPLAVWFPLLLLLLALLPSKARSA